MQLNDLFSNNTIVVELTKQRLLKCRIKCVTDKKDKHRQIHKSVLYETVSVYIVHQLLSETDLGVP